MKTCSELLLILIFLILAGCAPYQLEPLTMDHPAHPKALAAPEPPRSKTLAYTDADRPSIPTAQAAPVDMKMDVMNKGHDSGAAMGNAPQTAVGEGTVVAKVPSSSQLVVDHGEIKNFMDAMTMGYRVEPPSLLDGLESGDQVRFTIDKGKKAIIKVEKLTR